MKGKFMIIAALLGALTFGACVDTEESSSVTAVRNAKAEQLKSIATLNNAKAQAEATIAAAEAQIAAAQAQLIAAQAAAINAQTEAEKIKNQIAAAKAEAEIAALQAQLELDLLDYQEQLLQAKLDFNKAMQTLTKDEKANLEGIYTAYNTALENIATTKAAIAAANTEIAKFEAEIAKLDADKNWDDVVAAANKAVADAQKAVTDTEAKIAAKKSAYANIEAMGGVNYDVLCAQYDAAVKAEAAALKAYKYAVKNSSTKLTERTDNATAIANSDYYSAYDAVFGYNKYIGPCELDASYNVVYTDTPIQLVEADAIDEDGEVVGTGYKKAGLNAAGEYVSNGDVIAIYGTEETDYIEDLELIGLDVQYVVTKNALFAENLTDLTEEAAKIISTSEWAKAVEVAELKLAAWEKANEYDEIVDIYEDYLADKKAIDAKIAEKQAKMAANNYLISVYTATDYDDNDEEYEDEVEKLEDENDELEEDIEDLEDELDELVEELEDDLEDMYAEDEAEVLAAKAEYAALVADVEDAQDILDDVMAWEVVKALLNEVLISVYPEYEALVANDVVVAQAYYDAKVAETEAYYAWDDAAELSGKLLLAKDALAGSAADSAEYLMHLELKALAAEIDALETTLKTNKTTLADAQKAADKLAAMTEEEIAKSKDKYLADAIKALEAKIEAKEAEIVLLEQNLNVYEVELAGWTAALNDALAE